MSKKLTPEGWPDHIGDTGTLKFPDKSISKFTIKDEIRLQTSTSSSKVIYLQWFDFDSGKHEFRLCYYIKGKIGRTKGKWVFGQFATLLTVEDFRALISKAKARKWF